MKHKENLLVMTVATLGVVYGDIGTSPLYAVRESLRGLEINPLNVLGVLSLIFWSLILIISFKYLCIVLRADNDGEGGILALFALIRNYCSAKALKIFFVMAVFGAGLMLGDGMLTPAISVISAIEGLHIVEPSISHWVLPIAAIILIALFAVQYHGTQKVGFMFGPIIIIWFGTLAILGICAIIQNPLVIKALNPYYALEFFVQNGWTSYALLGGVFLVVTGGEAIYADLGHFSKRTIQLGWFLIALPGLLLNYFGQGAYLLDNPEAIINPFYSMAPTWFGIPLLVLATMATIIASQAVISATFSLTRQAILLGLYPSLPIMQTSKTVHGQIYIPQVNSMLAVGTLLILVIFQSSSAIAHAYGVAVNLVMILTTILITYVAKTKWQWSILKVSMLTLGLLFIELAFLGANLHKFMTGGWIPIAFAISTAFIMYSWQKGMAYLRKAYYAEGQNIVETVNLMQADGLYTLPKVSAVFVSDIYNQTGSSFLNFLKLSHTMPENVLILTYKVENIPHVQPNQRFELKKTHPNIHMLNLHYGFNDYISIPRALSLANKLALLPFSLSIDTVTYFVEIPNIVATEETRTLWFYWQEKLFAFLMRNYSSNINIEFYDLPYERTISIGSCKSI